MARTHNTRSIHTSRSARSGSTRKTTSKRSPSPGSRKADAIRMLKEDHQRVGELFDRFEGTRGRAQKERIAAKICEELKVHAQVEEEIFYRAAREAIDDEALMNEAEVEHASAKDLIRQIEKSSSEDDPRYDALVKVLGEYIKHHVKEEEGEMFKQVRASEIDLVALGEQMQQRKRELSANGAGRGRHSVSEIETNPAAW